MTIERGKPWGEPVTTPDDVMVVQNDSELSLCLPHQIVTLAGGSLWKSLGQPSVAIPGKDGTVVTIDAIELTVTYEHESTIVLAAASIEIGSWFSRARYITISNSSFVGELNLTPRAHPNDGFLDCLEISKMMTFRQRMSAYRRARTGTHIPHPDISTTRLTSTVITRQSRRERLTIDGVRRDHWTSIGIEVRPDYWHVVM